MPLVAWSEAEPVVEIRALGVGEESAPGPPWYSGTPAVGRFSVTVSAPPARPLALAIACDAPAAWVSVDGEPLSQPISEGPRWCAARSLAIPAAAWSDGRIDVEVGFAPSYGWSVVDGLYVGPAETVGLVATARVWEEAASHRLSAAGWVAWLFVAAGHALIGIRLRDRTALAYGLGLALMASGELANAAYYAVLGPWVPVVVVFLGNVLGTVSLSVALAVFFSLPRKLLAAAVLLELLGLVPGGVPLMMGGWLLVGAACLVAGARRRRVETVWVLMALLLALPQNVVTTLLFLGVPTPESMDWARWLYLLTPPVTGTALLVHRHLATWRNAQRFVPRDFLAALGHADLAEVAYGEQVELDMVVWFSDVRGFTSLLEGLAPAEVQPVLELSLGTQEAVIRRHGGFVDKYIGDAVMALFRDPDAAVAAALEARAEVLARSGGRLSVGIGLHRGPVMLGTVGSAERMDCTVVGDNVNLASRVEGVTKRYGAAILATRAVVDGLRRPVLTRPVERVIVKGRSEGVDLVEVLDPVLDAARVAVAAPVAAALAALEAGELGVAAPILAALRGAHADDGVVARLAERCEAWARDGVPADPRAVALHEK